MAEEEKQASHTTGTPACSSTGTLHLTPKQQRMYARIIDEYQLGERDVCLPIAKRFTWREIMGIIERCHGLTHDILTLLDATPSEWRAYLRKHPEMQATVEQAREAVVDRAEARMLEAVNSENEAIAEKSAEFVLKTLGKKRGWDTSPGSAQQITVGKDGEVSISQIFGLSE